jgi:hypothetical protein
MKSRIRFSMPYPAMTFAGLLAVASLAPVNPAHAQTVDGERALLNKTDASFTVSDTKTAPVVDGARALLGEAGSSQPQAFPSAGSPRATLEGAYRSDAEKALLGRSFGPRAPRPSSALRN